MLFSSTVFLFLFLPLVLLAYACTPARWKNHLLLATSLLFYYWGETFFVLVMLASILVNYGLGLLVDRAATKQAAKLVVVFAVVFNVGLLCAYKYVDFGLENLNRLVSLFGAGPIEFQAESHLPIGISFFTFQALSYVVDVYRGDAAVQKKPLLLALYVSMFPQLIAGPIVRYQAIEEQLEKRRVTLERMGLGVRRFVIGLGKKVLIAGALQVPADAVFDVIPGAELTPAMAWLGMICYGFQLYFDFSGYSDMAVGLGHFFGFTLPENFNYPYAARSVRDIWRRWHMSLTTWFRDYVYFPLGGSHGAPARTYGNLLLVFVLVGLWHGARWNFVFFGLYHGLLLVFERQAVFRRIERAPRVLLHVYTLSVWFLGLVIFRSGSLGQVGTVYATLFGAGPEPGAHPLVLSQYLDNEVLLVLPFAALLSLPVVPLLFERLRSTREALANTLSLVATTVVLLLSVLVMAATTNQPFIYFRF